MESQADLYKNCIFRQQEPAGNTTYSHGRANVYRGLSHNTPF